MFLDYPEVQLDTNLVENDIRPFVVGRKNWLFSGCPQGATTSFVDSVCEARRY
ncbi:IS66 family element, transposase domain protein [Leptospira mayottensis 200901122]|uniref:IS66 family element, transposase domain protein n=1 Tax=Leptospira mayottensis 200901122 TaxID=1193010 RepID=A0AA87SZV5_9LEPT|nr:IS66 family element, transposase domain protein [Leptospira mayottensis 200901122]